MRRRHPLAATTTAAFLAALPLASASAAPTVTRFPADLPNGPTCTGYSAPFQPTTGGVQFFVQNSGQRFAIDSAGQLGGETAPGGGISCVTSGATTSDGNAWGASIGDAAIIRYTLISNVTSFPTAKSNSFDITAADDGALWFAHQDGAHQMGRMTTGGVHSAFPASPGQLSGDPASVTAGPDGNVWFTESPILGQPPVHGLGRITTQGPAPGQGTITEFLGQSLTPTAITTGPDGNLWGLQGAGQPVFRRTLDGTLTTFFDGAVVVGNGASIVAGADGNLWISDPQNARVVRLTTSGAFTPVIVGGGPNTGLGLAPDGALWFVQQDGKAYGRIDPEPAPSYTDSAPLEVPAAGTTSGPANRYPATISASGHVGTVTGVTVRLNGIHHAYGADVTAQLVGPQGQSALLMANATNKPGDLTTPRDVLTGEVITIKSGARTAPRWLTSGVFDQIDPADGAFLVSFPAPAVNSPTDDLSVFNGTNPNGTWKLFVADDEGSFGTTGVIAGGWSLDIQTTGVDPTPTPTPAATQAPAQPTTSGPTPAPTAGAKDTTPPTLKLGKLPRSITLSALRKGLAIRVQTSEAATIQATLRAPAKGKTTGPPFPVELVRTTSTVPTDAAASLSLKPTAKRLGKPRKAFAIELALEATDAAGNRRASTQRIKVTVPRR